MPDFVYDILACIIDKIGKLSFDRVKVIKYDFLQNPAFWLDTQVNIISLNYFLNFFLWNKKGGTHVVMVLSHASRASTRFFPYTALSRAETSYLLPVLTFGRRCHFLRVKYIHSCIPSQTETYSKFKLLFKLAPEKSSLFFFVNHKPQ